MYEIQAKDGWKDFRGCFGKQTAEEEKTNT